MLLLFGLRLLVVVLRSLIFVACCSLCCVRCVSFVVVCFLCSACSCIDCCMSVLLFVVCF